MWPTYISFSTKIVIKMLENVELFWICLPFTTVIRHNGGTYSSSPRYFLSVFLPFHTCVFTGSSYGGSRKEMNHVNRKLTKVSKLCRYPYTTIQYLWRELCIHFTNCFCTGGAPTGTSALQPEVVTKWQDEFRRSESCQRRYRRMGGKVTITQTRSKS